MTKKTLYTKTLGRLVAKGAMTRNAGQFHIISGGTNWKVVKQGNLRPSKVFESQKDAIKYAKAVARPHSGSVLIHSRSGQVENKISFAS